MDFSVEMPQYQGAGIRVKVCDQVQPETRLERFRFRKQSSGKAEEIRSHRRLRHQAHRTSYFRQQRAQLSLEKCQQR